MKMLRPFLLPLVLTALSILTSCSHTNAPMTVPSEESRHVFADDFGKHPAGNVGRSAPSGSPSYGSPSISPAPPQSASPRAGSRSDDRPGLGTGRGDTRWSQVKSMSFRRASNSPTRMESIHYNDSTGIEAMARHLGGKSRSYRFPTAGGLIDWGLVNPSSGRLLPTYRSGGRILVVGDPGEEYAIEARNQSDRRLEVVLSVDGVDVMDGKAASVKKRGYILDPGEKFRIKGWRKSNHYVHAFEFAAVPETLTARELKTTRNVGVVGMAIFPEHHEAWYERKYRGRDTGSRLKAAAF